MLADHAATHTRMDKVNQSDLPSTDGSLITGHEDGRHRGMIHKRQVLYAIGSSSWICPCRKWKPWPWSCGSQVIVMNLWLNHFCAGNEEVSMQIIQWNSELSTLCESHELHGWVELVRNQVNRKLERNRLHKNVLYTLLISTDFYHTYEFRRILYGYFRADLCLEFLRTHLLFSSCYLCFV